MTDYAARAWAYEDAVRAGEIPACKWVRLACERNKRDRDRIGTPGWPYDFDAERAARVCRTAELLPHIKGPLAKVIGQDDDGRNLWNPIALEPWQCWLLCCVFGWVWTNTRRRRFRVALVLVPRKNAKSTLGAAIINYMLTADGESGAEVYSAATTRDQAKVSAEIAWEQARRSPAFRDYFGVKVGAKTSYSLTVPATASKFAPLSADAHTLDGLNVSCALVDELHAHKKRDVWDVLDTATGARLQPLIFAITTAGVDIGGICYEKLSYLHRVLEQSIEDQEFFGINYTIDDGDDWKDETSWRKANPNYGVSVQPGDLARKAREATQSPSSLNNFLTKHLNVWVSAEANWMPMDEWRACANPSLSWDSPELAEAPCWIGVDLAQVRDIAAIVAVFQLPEERFAVLGKYYLPEATVMKSPVAAYSGWVRQGLLTATPGEATYYRLIEDEIAALVGRYRVQAVCFDRALAFQMQQNLMERFGAEPAVMSIPQTIQVMNPAMQMLESLVVRHNLVHNGDPVLTWMASNVVVQQNSTDERFPLKAGGKDSNNKIDGIVALLTAGAEAFKAQPPLSVYETRGLSTIGAQA